MFIRILLFCSFPSMALAQESFHDLNMNGLISNCLEALEDGEDATPYSQEILSRSGFALGEANQVRGAECLFRATGERFIYESGRFIAPDEIQRLEDQALRAKQLAHEREAAYLATLIDACNQEFFRDRFRAITSPMCADVFRTNGLPKK